MTPWSLVEFGHNQWNFVLELERPQQRRRLPRGTEEASGWSLPSSLSRTRCQTEPAEVLTETKTKVTYDGKVEKSERWYTFGALAERRFFRSDFGLFFQVLGGQMAGKGRAALGELARRGKWDLVAVFMTWWQIKGDGWPAAEFTRRACRSTIRFLKSCEMELTSRHHHRPCATGRATLHPSNAL